MSHPKDRILLWFITKLKINLIFNMYEPYSDPFSPEDHLAVLAPTKDGFQDPWNENYFSVLVLL